MKKKLISWVVGVVSLVSVVAVADTLLSALTAAGAISGTDLFGCYQGANPMKKCTGSQLLTYIQTNVIVPISTGVSGLGTNVATALGVNAGSSGALVRTNDLVAGTPNITVAVPGTIGTTMPGDDLSGSGTAIPSSDNTKLVRVGAFSYTLAQATGSFGTGWSACLLNTGSGDATITATTSVFKGAGGTTTLVLKKQALACLRSNGTDYETGAAHNLVAGTNVTLTYNSDGTITIASSGGGGGLTCPTNFTAVNGECVWTKTPAADANCPGSVNCIFYTGLAEKEYEIRCRLVTAGASNVTGFEVGTGVGPTWQNAAGAYNRALANFATAGASWVDDNNVWLFADILSASGTGGQWDIKFHDFNTGGVTHTMTLVNHTLQTGNSATSSSQYGAGIFNTNTTALTALRLRDTQATPTSLGAASTCTLVAQGN